MKKKKIMMILGAVLVLALTGCGSGKQAGQGAETEESVQPEVQGTEDSAQSESRKEEGSTQPEGQETEGDTRTESQESGQNEAFLAQFYERQVPCEVMKIHQNEEAHRIYWNAEGEEVFSAYEYLDEGMYVNEDSESYLYIRYKDSEYIFDPAETNQLVVCLGMEGILEEEWDEFLNSPIFFLADEEESITEMTESDGNIHLVIERDAEGMEENYPYAADAFEPGDTFIEELDIDSETDDVKGLIQYLKKPDGTEVRLMQVRFSYDVAPYEPSEEMAAFMSGTDRSVTLITDPGTDKEKTYTRSCGENGVFAFYLAEGYERLYDDEDCTVVHEGQKEGDVLVYAAEGK